MSIANVSQNSPLTLAPYGLINPNNIEVGKSGIELVLTYTKAGRQVASAVVTAQQMLTNSWPSAPAVAVDAAGTGRMAWRQADDDETIYYMVGSGTPAVA